MTRLGVVFWGGLVLASGFATFNVKYAVQGIDDELARVRRQTIAETQEIRVLTAEWAYLNQPDRLAELNRSFLQLAPMNTKQLQGRVDEIALRTLPAGGEATAPPTMVAANPPETAPSAASPPAANRPGAMPAAAGSPAAPSAAAPADGVRAGGTAVAEIRGAERPAEAVQVADTQLAEVASGGTRSFSSLSEAATALAQVLHLLGPDGGGRTRPVQPAKAAPVATTPVSTTQAAAAEGANSGAAAVPVADARGADTKGGDVQTAEAASGTVRNADNTADAAALAEALRVLGVAAGGQIPRVRVAKASPVSLDALISKIADPR